MFGEKTTNCFLLLQGVPWVGVWWLERLVFYTLIVLGIAVSLNIFLKYRKFRQMIKYSYPYAPRVAMALKELNIEKAIEISEEFEKSHLAQVVRIGLKGYLHLRETSSRELASRQAKESMERHANTLKYQYEKGMGFLDAVGRTSPFIGALGGSTTTFAMGILIAIPTVWFATYERNKSNQLILEIKNTASELIDYMERNSNL